MEFALGGEVFEPVPPARVARHAHDSVECLLQSRLGGEPIEAVEVRMARGLEGPRVGVARVGVVGLGEVGGEGGDDFVLRCPRGFVSCGGEEGTDGKGTNMWMTAWARGEAVT